MDEEIFCQMELVRARVEERRETTQEFMFLKEESPIVIVEPREERRRVEESWVEVIEEISMSKMDVIVSVRSISG